MNDNEKALQALIGRWMQTKEKPAKGRYSIYVRKDVYDAFVEYCEKQTPKLGVSASIERLMQLVLVDEGAASRLKEKTKGASRKK